MSSEMKVDIGEESIEYLFRQEGHVKIISDVPLEWINKDRIPLMLRCETSRIPTTPGNLFFAECTLNKHVMLSLADFTEVLIIRSFDKADIIADLLERCIDIVSAMDAAKLNVKFVDVNSEQEFVDALNMYKGAVLVLDAHGKNKGVNDVSGIVINGEVINIWELRGKVRMPPIVLMSVCDTHPIDGSHASSAMGFLNAGAYTVLSTLLPVSATESAKFISRFLLRMQEYLPIVAINFDSIIRWSTVIVGMQRMAYITELIDMVLSKKQVPMDRARVIKEEVQMTANIYINSYDVDWYTVVINKLIDESGFTEPEIHQVIDDWMYLSEACKYVQLGCPESILILSDTAEKNSAAMHNKYPIRN